MYAQEQKATATSATVSYIQSRYILMGAPENYAFHVGLFHIRGKNRNIESERQCWMCVIVCGLWCFFFGKENGANALFPPTEINQKVVVVHFHFIPFRPKYSIAGTSNRTYPAPLTNGQLIFTWRKQCLHASLHVFYT